MLIGRRKQWDKHPEIVIKANWLLIAAADFTGCCIFRCKVIFRLLFLYLSVKSGIWSSLFMIRLTFITIDNSFPITSRTDISNLWTQHSLHILWFWSARIVIADYSLNNSLHKLDSWPFSNSKTRPVRFLKQFRLLSRPFRKWVAGSSKEKIDHWWRFFGQVAFLDGQARQSPSMRPPR